MRSRDVMPEVAAGQVVKFMPKSPPCKGDIVLVGDQRCRVTRSRVTWDGPQWTLHSLKVKPT